MIASNSPLFNYLSITSAYSHEISQPLPFPVLVYMSMPHVTIVVGQANNQVTNENSSKQQRSTTSVQVKSLFPNPHWGPQINLRWSDSSQSSCSASCHYTSVDKCFSAIKIMKTILCNCIRNNFTDDCIICFVEQTFLAIQSRTICDRSISEDGRSQWQNVFYEIMIRMLPCEEKRIKIQTASLYLNKNL